VPATQGKFAASGAAGAAGCALQTHLDNMRGRR